MIVEMGIEVYPMHKLAKGCPGIHRGTVQLSQFGSAVSANLECIHNSVYIMQIY